MIYLKYQKILILILASQGREKKKAHFNFIFQNQFALGEKGTLINHYCTGVSFILSSSGQ